MIAGTTYLLKNEPCAGVYELNYQSPNSKGFHRYQIVLVVRDDKLAEYRKDLGNSKKFKGVDQFRIPGGMMSSGKFKIVHTVDELLGIAQELRHGKNLFDKLELVGTNKIKE